MDLRVIPQTKEEASCQSNRSVRLVENADMLTRPVDMIVKSYQSYYPKLHGLQRIANGPNCEEMRFAVIGGKPSSIFRREKYV